VPGVHVALGVEGIAELEVRHGGVWANFEGPIEGVDRMPQRRRGGQ
jgi:hypothetical protein